MILAGSQDSCFKRLTQANDLAAKAMLLECAGWVVAKLNSAENDRWKKSSRPMSE